MIRLYDNELSGDCYKVRQLLAWLHLPHEKVKVNVHPGREHRSPEFLALVNPLGELPVLDDDSLRLRNAQAILVYLASRHGADGPWYPDEPALRGQVCQWLATAEALSHTAGAARAHDTLGDATVDIAPARAGAMRQFRLLDDHLAERQSAHSLWLVGSGPSIADIACFPFVALAQDGGLRLDAFPALCHWVWQFRQLPGFIGMAGIRVP